MQFESSFYAEDLAYIHHAGFSDHARQAGEAVLGRLHRAGIGSGLVVDLGCGSGVWAKMLAAAGFEVLGFDISQAMIRLARREAPGGDFHLKSIREARIPPCVAVTAFGEVLNYRTEDRPARPVPDTLFRKVAAGLVPEGLFVFDVCMASGGPPMEYRSWRTGPDWAVLVAVSEQPVDRVVRRDITLFRKIGNRYRRSAERHLLDVLDSEQVASLLRAAGFVFETAESYGEQEVEARRRVYFARKETSEGVMT